MGNRAVIAFDDKSNSPAIYVHWNGGPESILGFVNAAKVIGARSPDSDKQYSFGYLAAVIGTYFADGLSFGIGTIATTDTDNGDNGLYLVKSWDDIRQHPKGEGVCRGRPVTMDTLAPDERQKSLAITELIYDRWQALRAVNGPANKTQPLDA